MKSHKSPEADKLSTFGHWKMHKYITHGSKQISKDYRDAYFLKKEKKKWQVLMWFTERLDGRTSKQET